MSFLKKIFNKTPQPVNEVQLPEILQNGIPEDAETFLQRIEILKHAGFGPAEYQQKLRYFINRMPDWLLKEVSQKPRNRMLRTDVPESLDATITKDLVSFRLSLYQPTYKKQKDPGLGKLFLILFNLAPELVRTAGSLSSDGDVSLASSVELDQLMSDLSIFNLSESEIKYTVSKILQYNRQNVAYTDDEVIVLNNSELMRDLLEQLTVILQQFVQDTADWTKYLKPEEIGLSQLHVRILDIDAKAFFRDDGARFLHRFTEAESVSKLESQVDRKLQPLFRRDVQLLIGNIRRTLQREHLELIQSLRALIASSIMRLHEHGELPPQPIMKALLEKSMGFHRNYYPDLVQAVSPSVFTILEVAGAEYRTIYRVPRIFENEIARGMVEHIKRKPEQPIRYETFIQELKSRIAPAPEQTGRQAADYQPEEMAFLKRNPDAELAIIMMNEKLAQAEASIPLLDDEWFYSSREDYLKIALLEILQAMISSQAPLKLVRSLLLKSMDRERKASAAIMEKLVNRLKEDGFKWSLVQKLLAKQKKKYHICTLIKRLLAEDERWNWFVAEEDPPIELDKFSTVTGLAFFRGNHSTGPYKITARFEENTWSITHISPDSR